MDGWLRLLLHEEIVPKLEVLRCRIDDVFLRRLTNPAGKPSPMDQATIGVVMRVVWEEMQRLSGMKNLVCTILMLSGTLTVGL